MADIIDAPSRNLTLVTAHTPKPKTSTPKKAVSYLQASLTKRGGGLTETVGSVAGGLIDPRVRKAEDLFLSGCPKRAESATVQHDAR